MCIISRSGGMSSSTAYFLGQAGVRISSIVHIGGDAVLGLRLPEVAEMFEKDPETDAIVLFGEIGSSQEEDLADLIKAGKITHMVVLGENLVKYGFPTELLQKLQLLVVLDILPSITTKIAHYVLPGAAHVEKRGTFTNAKGRVQKVHAAWMPKGNARE